jgi:signal transduction histidine kinase
MRLKARRVQSMENKSPTILLAIEDITELRRIERAQRILIEVGRVFVPAQDYENGLVSLTSLLVPDLADWATVDLLDEDGRLRRVTAAHTDPEKVTQVHELHRHYPPDLNVPYGAPDVLRTNQPELTPSVSDALLKASAHNLSHLQLLRQLGIESSLIVPLADHERTLGVITLVWAESGRRYGSADLALAEEIARRVSLAIRHAQLFAHIQHLNAELEARVIGRTSELEATNARLGQEVREHYQARNELEASHKQLLNFANHLQSVREEESTRIAREVHDELGQQLTVLKMGVAWLRQHLASDQTPLLEKAKELLTEIDTTLQVVRRIAGDLRPVGLEEFGLVSTMEWRCQKFQEQFGVDCHFTSTVVNLYLDQMMATSIFRVFQEALTNVARHANARRVDASLSEEAGRLCLTIRDNGRGITEDELTKGKSLGLMGMRERIRLLGGKLSIEGRPGEGTTLTFSIPMRPTDPAKGSPPEEPGNLPASPDAGS